MEKLIQVLLQWILTKQNFHSTYQKNNNNIKEELNMKNLFYVALVLIASIIMVSCDSTTDPVTPTPDPKGNLFVSSIPAGAQIWGRWCKHE